MNGGGYATFAPPDDSHRRYDEEEGLKRKKMPWRVILSAIFAVLFATTFVASSGGSMTGKSRVKPSELDIAFARYGSEEPSLVNDRKYKIEDDYEEYEYDHNSGRKADAIFRGARSTASHKKNKSTIHGSPSPLERLNAKLGGMVWPFDGPKPSGDKETVKGSVPFKLSKLGADDGTGTSTATGVDPGTANDLTEDSEAEVSAEEADEQKKMEKQIEHEEEVNATGLTAPAIDDDVDIYDPAFHNPQKEFYPRRVESDWRRLGTHQI